MYWGWDFPNILPEVSSREDGLFAATMLPCVKVAVPLVPEKTFPCPQDVIVVVPPARTVAPPLTPTAMGTLFNLMLFKTSEPPSFPLLAVDVRIKMGVLVTTASMMASDPTV